MKNIHVLPTDKPSRLYFNTKAKYYAFSYTVTSQGGSVSNRHIYITSDEEIKEGDWVLGDYPDNPICKVIAKYGQEFTAQSLNGDKYGLAEYDSKKIILTTDQDLIKDGVQAIDDEFLEWFVKNPSCEEVGIEPLMAGFVDDEPSYYENMYDIIIPKEEPKFENSIKNSINIMSIANDMFGKKEEPKQRLEKYSERFDNKENELVEGVFNPENWGKRLVKEDADKDSFEDVTKYKKERMYSEEEVFNLCRDFAIFVQQKRPSYKNQLEWFEQFKKK
jgi:hypothetical protein